MSNAIKFTPPGGEVSIKIESLSEKLHFSVADTGIGIPADAQNGVFERFRQVNKDSRGLGLGLHISKYIVEAHGGTMWVESKLGNGSTFHFVLPNARLGSAGSSQSEAKGSPF